MNYEIYYDNNPVEPCKMVRFENGYNTCVHNNAHGMEYFSIPNMYRPNPTNDLDKMNFVGRCHDAILAVRNGHGDTFYANMWSEFPENVFRYVDREYGESIRSRKIEELKDVEFGWSLKFELIGMRSQYITSERRLFDIFNAPGKYIFLDTEGDAWNLKDEIIIKAEEFASAYNAIKDKPEWILDNIRNALKGNVFSEIGWLISDEVNYIETPWKLNVVQTIRNKR